MWTKRKATKRGHASHGWLDSRHTFSFANYYDPKFMGFGPLRVINDDRVVGGAGFPTHPHRDMEIITMVVEGALAHQDTTGGGSVIRPGDFQHLTAGRGVRHSEFNASDSDDVRFLQIWIEPEAVGKDPAYQERSIPVDLRQGRFALVASSAGGDGAFRLGQDVNIYTSVVNAGEAAATELAPGRKQWMQVVRGRVRIDDDTELVEGDGAWTDNAQALRAMGLAPQSEIVVFDCP